MDNKISSILLEAPISWNLIKEKLGAIGFKEVKDNDALLQWKDSPYYIKKTNETSNALQMVYISKIRNDNGGAGIVRIESLTIGSSSSYAFRYIIIEDTILFGFNSYPSVQALYCAIIQPKTKDDEWCMVITSGSGYPYIHWASLPSSGTNTGNVYQNTSPNNMGNPNYPNSAFECVKYFNGERFMDNMYFTIVRPKMTVYSTSIAEIDNKRYLVWFCGTADAHPACAFDITDV